jgi:hypothetical protein
MRKEYEENEKRAKDIEERYKCLDGLSRDGYIWEFVRRTKTYIKLYERFTKLSKIRKPDYNHIAECLEAVRTMKIEPIIAYENKPPCSPHLATIKFTPFLDDKETIPELPVFYSLPDYHINYHDFTSIPDVGHPVQVIGRHRYKILLGFPEKIDSHKYRRIHPQWELPYLFDSRYSKPMKPYQFLNTFLSPKHKTEDTIFVGISKMARTEDLYRIIKEVTPFLSKEKPRRTERKWKFYLIIYDLLQDEFDFRKISNILSMLDERFSEIKNVENSYKAAKVLIDKEQYKTLF